MWCNPDNQELLLTVIILLRSLDQGFSGKRLEPV